jgi:hypothetical protein
VSSRRRPGRRFDASRRERGPASSRSSDDDRAAAPRCTVLFACRPKSTVFPACPCDMPTCLNAKSSMPFAVRTYRRGDEARARTSAPLGDRQRDVLATARAGDSDGHGRRASACRSLWPHDCCAEMQPLRRAARVHDRRAHRQRNLSCRSPLRADGTRRGALSAAKRGDRLPSRHHLSSAASLQRDAPTPSRPRVQRKSRFLAVMPVERVWRRVDPVAGVVLELDDVLLPGDGVEAGLRPATPRPAAVDPVQDVA